MSCCSHLFEIGNDVTPKTPDGCEECLKTGDRWVHFGFCQPYLRLEPQAVGIQEPYQRDGRVENLRRECGQVIKHLLVGGVENSIVP